MIITFFVYPSSKEQASLLSIAEYNFSTMGISTSFNDEKRANLEEAWLQKQNISYSVKYEKEVFLPTSEIMFCVQVVDKVKEELSQPTIKEFFYWQNSFVKKENFLKLIENKDYLIYSAEYFGKMPYSGKEISSIVQ